MEGGPARLANWPGPPGLFRVYRCHAIHFPRGRLRIGIRIRGLRRRGHECQLVGTGPIGIEYVDNFSERVASPQIVGASDKGLHRRFDVRDFSVLQRALPSPGGWTDRDRAAGNLAAFLPSANRRYREFTLEGSVLADSPPMPPQAHRRIASALAHPVRGASDPMLPWLR